MIGATSTTTTTTAYPQGPQMDPNAYAQQYANQNGITLEEAKAELKSKYGDPKAPEADASLFSGLSQPTTLQNNANPYGIAPEEQELLECGIPIEVILEGDDAIMKFIEDNNVTGYSEKDTSGATSEHPVLDFFKGVGGAALNFITGGNSTNNDGFEGEQNPYGLNPQEQQLFEAGVPLDVISQGDDAIMKFLQDNNITVYPQK
ncbi:MAG: hypothetical protein IJ877_04365 [Candidatus Gastranaerophilales bacterium]|nr:hypothetical protein [Candidatus Gastranaerophilales bacterium]